MFLYFFIEKPLIVLIVMSKIIYNFLILIYEMYTNIFLYVMNWFLGWFFRWNHFMSHIQII